jgi:hypothetical protein
MICAKLSYKHSFYKENPIYLLRYQIKLPLNTGRDRTINVWYYTPVSSKSQPK